MSRAWLCRASERSEVLHHAVLVLECVHTAVGQLRSADDDAVVVEGQCLAGAAQRAQVNSQAAVVEEGVKGLPSRSLCVSNDLAAVVDVVRDDVGASERRGKQGHRAVLVHERARADVAGRHRGADNHPVVVHSRRPALRSSEGAEIDHFPEIGTEGVERSGRELRPPDCQAGIRGAECFALAPSESAEVTDAARIAFERVLLSRGRSRRADNPRKRSR